MELLGRFTRTGPGSSVGPVHPDRSRFWFHGIVGPVNPDRFQFQPAVLRSGSCSFFPAISRFRHLFSGGFTVLRFAPVRNLSRTVLHPYHNQKSHNNQIERGFTSLLWTGDLYKFLVELLSPFIYLFISTTFQCDNYLFIQDKLSIARLHVQYYST